MSFGHQLKIIAYSMRAMTDADVQQQRLICSGIDKMEAEITALRETVKRLEGERDEIQDVFDRQWSADMRGIKAWQAKNPGNDLVWPDRAYLVDWLLTQRDAALAEVGRMRALLSRSAPIIAKEGWSYFSDPGYELAKEIYDVLGLPYPANMRRSPSTTDAAGKESGG